MGLLGRRQFIYQSSVLMANGLFEPSRSFRNKKTRLSFSTLGCPDWTFDQILSFAKKNGYHGIEWRGILRQMDLTHCNEWRDASSKKLAKEKMAAHGLQFVNLGSSCTLHYVPGPERTKQLDEGKRYIDLAEELECPYIRVFPNNFPKGQDKNQTLELIISGLNELSSHAKGSRVRVLMETHGDLVYASELSYIMQSVSAERTGLIWDPSNMWTITKESPAQVFKQLQSYIHHVHLKDANWQGGQLVYCFLGKGSVPLKEIIDVLRNGQYKGFYSYEWEKLWHPELAEPEVALADFPKAIKNYL